MTGTSLHKLIAVATAYSTPADAKKCLENSGVRHAVCPGQLYKRRQIQHFVRRPDVIAGSFDKHAMVAQERLARALGCAVTTIAHQCRYSGFNHNAYFAREVVLTTAPAKWYRSMPL